MRFAIEDSAFMARATQINVKRKKENAMLEDLHINIIVNKIVLLFAFMFMLIVLCTVSEANEAHDFDTFDCYKCHRSPWKDPTNLVNKSISELCMRCHKMVVKTSSHPVEMEPYSAKAPSYMPLRNNLLTCVTCHDIHSEQETDSGEKTYFLRRTSFNKGSFCISCHVQDDRYSQPIENSGHIYGTNIAHVGVYYRKQNISSEFDAISAACLSCHDGSIAYDPGHNGPGEHPIGTDYRNARMSNPKLKPFQDVVGEIKLFNRKVTCGTCHDFYSTSKNKLVKSNDGSKLCLSCHIA